jgi:peptidoglycan/xylan/chitin deacetylase (PgdA/CDA1 family)
MTMRRWLLLFSLAAFSLLAGTTGAGSRAADTYVEGTVWAASERGDVKALEALLQERPELINAPATMEDLADPVAWPENTPLVVATKHARSETVLFLLLEGADPDAPGYRGARPLHHAVEHPEMIGLLLNAEADPNAKDDNGTRPIHRAILQTAPIESVAELLAFGADPNHPANFRGIKGSTALHLALRSGADDSWKQEVVKLLCRYGANPEASDQKGQTPLQLAAGDALRNALLDTPEPGKRKEPLGLTPPEPPAMEDLADTSWEIDEGWRGRTIVRARPTTGEKLVALTFDDGPHPWTTPRVLEILRTKNVAATFFLIGNQIGKEEVVSQIIDEGHVIGNHSFSHPTEKQNLLQALREIDLESERLKRLGAPTINLFRPPGGVLDNGLADYAAQRGYVNVMWSYDVYDWRNEMDADELVDAVVDPAKPGDIVLLHDGGGKRETLVEALPRIIDGLRAKGYKLVTVPQLLRSSRAPE